MEIIAEDPNPPAGMLNEHELTEDNNQLYLCCGGGRTSDKRLLTFTASATLSLIVVVFSCYQLTQGLDCSQENVYSSLISLVIGVWLKSPMGE